jgi:nitroreductase
MSLSQDDFAAMVSEANLAPSVHNTQPTRWRLEPDGRVSVLEAVDRRLPVGDPQGHDAGISHGAAIEGFALACAARGRGLMVQALDGVTFSGLRPVAQLSLSEEAEPDPLQVLAPVRRTYRGAFAPAQNYAALDALELVGDVRLIRTPEGVAHLAQLNDEASLRAFRNGAYRAELLSWMRLSRRDSRWAVDGLNAEAMEMSPFEALGAGFVLRPGVFETLDRAGAASALVAEAKVVRSAHAIALFHRPNGEPPLETGRRFYRFWLEVAALGLSMAPMAVLADDPIAHRAIGEAFAMPQGRHLVTAFRLGKPVREAKGAKPRLPLHDLLV